MIMNILLTSFLIWASLFGSISTSDCCCRKAPNESPVLGNVPVVATGGTVRVVRGKVLYPNGEIVKGAIVEVFDNFLGTDDWQNADHEAITARPRRAVCATGDDGSFCFANLPPGRYLIRAGARSPDQGFSAVSMFVRVTRRGSRRGLEIQLGQSI